MIALAPPNIYTHRLADPNDKYLMTWKRVANNPVKFEGRANAFPGAIWKNNGK